MFWTLTLVVSVKYVLIVMRADNDGEGGIMACRAWPVGPLRRRCRGAVLLLGIAGAALFYGDGMITPAISVLSAVEGVEVVDRRTWVLPLPVGRFSSRCSRFSVSGPARSAGRSAR